MKTLTAALFSPLALASMPSGPKHMADVNLKSTTPVAGTSNTTGGAYCGVGYTYCGYILKEQKNFDDATILTAYCSAGFCDSSKGTTQTDPLQALFVCLPESAVPKRDVNDAQPYTGPVKIEVLCACSGKAFGGGENVCLNPDADHIGRCSTPCLNASPS